MSEIEQDILFQRFYQEVIKNFNAIDQKLLLDQQRCHRDILTLRNEVEELRRQLRDSQGLNVGMLERGEIEREIETTKTTTNKKLLELETKQMKGKFTSTHFCFQSLQKHSLMLFLYRKS